jgi:hypothetical protein
MRVAILLGLGVEYGVEGLSAYLTFKSIHRKA